MNIVHNREYLYTTVLFYSIPHLFGGLNNGFIVNTLDDARYVLDHALFF